MQIINDRITKAEVAIENLKLNVEKNARKIEELDEKVDTRMATKEDLKELQNFFESRESDFTKNMWRVIFGLLGVLGAISLAAFGIEKLPHVF